MPDVSSSDYEESNIEITEEVSLKFGKDKILISYNNPSVLELHKEKIEIYLCRDPDEPHQIRDSGVLPSVFMRSIRWRE
ncbi:MAG: hypothetical protein ACLST2_09255 [Waltera sp.]